MQTVLLVGAALERTPPTLRETLERAGFSVHVCPAVSAQECSRFAKAQCWVGIEPDAVVIREQAEGPTPPCADLLAAPTLIVEESAKPAEVDGRVCRIGRARGPVATLHALEAMLQSS